MKLFIFIVQFMVSIAMYAIDFGVVISSDEYFDFLKKIGSHQRLEIMLDDISIQYNTNGLVAFIIVKDFQAQKSEMYHITKNIDPTLLENGGGGCLSFIENWQDEISQMSLPEIFSEKLFPKSRTLNNPDIVIERLGFKLQEDTIDYSNSVKSYINFNISYNSGKGSSTLPSLLNDNADGWFIQGCYAKEASNALGVREFTFSELFKDKNLYNIKTKLLLKRRVGILDFLVQYIKEIRKIKTS